MKKELILITISIFFSVLIMTGMTYVFSWDEPEDAMPSNYVAPVNTGASSQIKYGELSAPIFSDTADSGFYLDPAQTSILNQINAENIQATNNICLNSGICLSQLSDYIDGQFLVYGIHTFGDCETNGGELLDDPNSSAKFCKFLETSTCPENWFQYQNWSTTTARTCSVVNNHQNYAASETYSCTTGSHSIFSTTPNEQCTYSGVLVYLWSGNSSIGWLQQPLLCSGASIDPCFGSTCSAGASGTCYCDPIYTSMGCY